LPLRVTVQVRGDQWDRTYSEVITVQLDDKKTKITLNLKTVEDSCAEWKNLFSTFNSIEPDDAEKHDFLSGVPVGLSLFAILMNIVISGTITPNGIMTALGIGLFAECFFRWLSVNLVDRQ